GEAGKQLSGIDGEDRVHRLDRAAAIEEVAAGKHARENEPAGEDVGAMVDDLAADLLGRHVLRRAGDLAVHGDGGVIGTVLGRDGGALVREPEIQKLDETFARDHYVAWFEIAMHDG